MILIFLGGLLGIVLLLFGANLVVSKAQGIARLFNVSEFFIGLTVLSIGTSLPELATHVMSSIKILQFPTESLVLSGLAVGTNVGSNIIQITLITGIVGFFGVVKSSRRFMLHDYLVMLGAILLLFFLSLNGVIGRIEGVILVVAYLVYIFTLAKDENLTHKVNKSKEPIWQSVLLLLLGVVMLFFASNLIVDSALLVSKVFNLTGSLIGTLVIGVATALPELTTALFALGKKSTQMSIGTLVGSNITNPLLIVGVGAIISRYSVGPQLLWFDLPIWFLVSAIGFFFLWNGQYMMKKWQAVTLFGLYFVYVGARLFFLT